MQDCSFNIVSSIRCSALLVLTFWLSCCHLLEAQGQAIAESAMQAELVRLAEICDSIPLPAEAQLLRTWMPADCSNRELLYLPIEHHRPLGTSAAQKGWAERFKLARQGYAESLFAEALAVARAGNELKGFSLLWRVLREDPEHAEANRILGTLASAATVRPRLRRASLAEVDFGWASGSYSTIRTPHFVLTTRAEPKESIELAVRMEKILALWRQVFYPLWSRPGALAGKCSGDNSPWSKPAVMQVVLLKDREEYLKVLGVDDPNAKVSVGYYAPQAQKTLFYPDANLDATLVHELTHQFFAEATSFESRKDAGEGGGIWLLEGIALYMESLREHSSYWSIGGIDAERLQSARYRAIRDGYWVPWKEFTGAGKSAWQNDVDIARLYTQAAGLTHVLMDNRKNTDSRTALMQSIVQLYQGGAEADGLLPYLGGSASETKSTYERSLILTDADVLGLCVDPEGNSPIQSLVLAGSELDSSNWPRLALHTDLRWLDLSFSNCTNDDLLWLPKLTKLERLSVEGSYVDGGLIETISKLRSLDELDLSGCSIDDASLASLSGNQTLRTLWLTKTKVTAAALETLKTMPNLSFCDIEGTVISAEQWRAFVNQHPGLSKNNRP